MSETTKQTPGLWLISETASGKIKVTDRNGFSICNITVGPYSTQRANARLIAAAPDLYAALERLMRETNRGLRTCTTEVAELADAALAKARVKPDDHAQHDGKL